VTPIASIVTEEWHLNQKKYLQNYLRFSGSWDACYLHRLTSCKCLGRR